MISTKCHDCATRPMLKTNAQIKDADWTRHPIEVQDRKCITCKRRLAWWWFWCPSSR